MDQTKLWTFNTTKIFYASYFLTLNFPIYVNRHPCSKVLWWLLLDLSLCDFKCFEGQGNTGHEWVVKGGRLYLRSATGYKYPLSHTWRSVSSRDCLIRTFSTCGKKEDIWACPQCLNLHDCINLCLRTIPSNFQSSCVWETSPHTPVAPQAMYMCMYLTHFQYTNTHGERGLERLSCAVTSADASRDYFWPFYNQCYWS